MTLKRPTLLLLLVPLISGCAHYPVNAPLPHVDPCAGYRFQNVAPQTNSDDLALMPAFSGGGTRAAALSYSVLTEITTYVIELHFNQLRDESDRLFFNSVHTSLQLPSATVDRLYRLAARQLADNDEFKRLVSELNGGAMKAGAATTHLRQRQN